MVIEQKDFDKIQLLAAQKTAPVKNSPWLPAENMPINSLINGQKGNKHS